MAYNAPPVHANPSGSFHFPGMRDLTNMSNTNHSRGEFRWHAAIDARWSTTTAAQRSQILAFCARNGPMQSPINAPTGSEDFVRAHYWRRPRSVPRCHTCWSKQHGLPATIAQIPIGLGPRPVLPCGCFEQEALFEQWAVGVGIYTKLRDNAPGQAGVRVAAMGKGDRKQFLQVFASAIGVPAAQINWDHLSRWTARRNAIQTRIANGPNDSGVQAWPLGT